MGGLAGEEHLPRFPFSPRWGKGLGDGGMRGGTRGEGSANLFPREPLHIPRTLHILRLPTRQLAHNSLDTRQRLVCRLRLPHLHPLKGLHCLAVIVCRHPLAIAA